VTNRAGMTPYVHAKPDRAARYHQDNCIGGWPPYYVSAILMSGRGLPIGGL
jgi:predicted lipoprotein with Yx(FWY)xxD motif